MHRQDYAFLCSIVAALGSTAAVLVMVFAPEPAKPAPLPNAAAVTSCLLERTDFDPYTTTEGVMAGAMRFCLLYVQSQKR